jgi:hypothetical protein
MFRWTNSFPYFFNHLKFIKKDPEHLDEYIKTWDDMVEAYKSGDTSSSPMADVYVPDAGLCPSEYGLIVVDYSTMTLLQCQCYSHLGYLDTFHFKSVHKDIAENEDEREENRRIMDLFNDGRMVHVDQGRRRPLLDVSKMTFEQIAEIDGYVGIDMKPWTLRGFQWSKKGFEEFKQEVLKLGFVLTPEENAQWDEFLKLHFQS